MPNRTFRAAIEAGEIDEALACMTPEVVLHSPVTFKPFEGRQAVATLFGILFRTFEDFRYVGEFTAEDGSEVLHFRTRIGERDIEGIDMIHYDAQGMIDDFTVFVRPLSAVNALRDAIGAQLAAGTS
jgi:SnoaL-like protein